jgi:FkbM family methyltransferase
MPLIAQTPRNKKFLSNNDRYPRYINFLDRKKTAVQRQIRRGGLGSYESDFQSAFLSLCELQAGHFVVYDIGAHIGFYSALASCIFGGRRGGPFILAFEPTPSTAKEAISLRDANGFVYQVLQVAVGASAGSTELFLSTKAETSNSMNPDFRPGSTPITVEVTTIDKVYSSGAPAPGIIKIDVETFETEVIRGAFHTILKTRPYITCEMLPSASKRDLKATLGMLDGLEYTFYQVTKEDEFQPRGVEDSLEAISSDDRDWIFAPSKLGDDFFEMKRNWSRALKDCETGTNVLVEGGVDCSKYLEKLW